MIVLILSVIVLLGLMACTLPIKQPAAAAAVVQSNKPRETSPATNPTDIDTLVNDNSAFAFNLYKALKDIDGNLFYSPYSISEALAMTYGGARGDTEKQMADTLQFYLPQAQLHPAFNSLDLQLAQRGQGSKGSDGKGFRLHVVNAIWGQQGFPFLPDYLDLLAQNYGAGLRLLDFVKDAESSRQTINDWVSQQTEEKINNLLPPNSVNDTTRLVLTNAIYFNAAWLSQFNPESTIDGQFHLLTGGDVPAKMMNQTESLGYVNGDDYQAVELPYDGDELSMLILLPQAGHFKDFESALNSQVVNDIIDSIKYQQVAISIPKFKIESGFSLKSTLSTMGMPLAFTDNANFSGMDGRTDLEISDVIHKAYVSVDEAGTEAAAASGVIMALMAMPTPPVQITVDHPFIFLIRDIKTGTILFVGRVTNPGS